MTVTLKTLIPKETSKKATFDSVYAETSERIYFLIRRIILSHDDTDDVMQNTYIKVWKGMDTFRGDAGWYTWIYRIATNESISFLEKRKKLLGVSLDSLEGELWMQLKSDSWFNGDEAEAKLQEAIAILPEKQKLVFIMKYYDGLKYEAIAEITETSVGGLKASYHHAVAKVKTHLKESFQLNFSLDKESK